MSSLESIILVALLGIIGNIIYFEYSGQKQHRKEIKKELLVSLLLPLYIVLKIDELEWQSLSKDENFDLYEHEADTPKRLLKNLDKILQNNLYLADGGLHTVCMNFMQWAYGSDTNDRFQRLHIDSLEEDNNFVEFRNVIYKKYEKERKRYLL